MHNLSEINPAYSHFFTYGRRDKYLLELKELLKIFKE